MALIQCPECGEKVSGLTGACPSCGYPLNTLQQCPECGVLNEKGRVACENCGYPFAEDEKTESPEITATADHTKADSAKEPELEEERFNLKTIIRIIAVLLLILFIIPTFTVSCSGEEEDISAFDIMRGLSLDYYDGTTEELTDPEPIVILGLLIPLALLALAKMKKRKAVGLATLLCATADLIFWLALKSGVVSAAADWGCTADTKWTFGVGIALIVVEAALGAIEAFLLPFMNTGPICSAAVDKVKLSATQLQNTPLNSYIGRQWVCTCGESVNAASNFCPSCGKHRPEQEKPPTCPNCEAKVNATDQFCQKCGTKLPAATNKE